MRRMRYSLCQIFRFSSWIFSARWQLNLMDAELQMLLLPYFYFDFHCRNDPIDDRLT